MGLLAPIQANSGHDGTEQVFAGVLALQAQGEPGSNAGLNWSGGTPNHKAEAWASAYGWALRQPKGAPDYVRGRQVVIAFLRGQLKTYMAIGGVSEFETSSHNAWWDAAWGSIWLQASKAGDAEVLALIRRLMVQKLTLEAATATPSGHVVILGARCFLGTGKNGDADQREQRNEVYALLAGKPVRLPSEVMGSVPPPSTDRLGVWLFRQIPASEMVLVRNAKPEMPSTLDAIQIERTKTGHVCWCDVFHGLRPAYYAWVNYATGQEKYGVDPAWPKGQPGGARPASLPVPTAGTPLKVWHLGLTAQ